jgi:probable rRNA maturation factor
MKAPLVARARGAYDLHGFDRLRRPIFDVCQTGISSTSTDGATASEICGSEGGESASGEAGEPSHPPSAADQASAGQFQVEVSWRADTAGADCSNWLRLNLEMIGRLCGSWVGQVAVIAVDDRMMSDLHRRFKGRDSPTDVLTFDLRQDLAGDLIEADIVVCVNEAIRQAARRGHQARQELLLYAVHGILHLTGFDDAFEADAERMHRREDELLAAAGLPTLFKTGEHAH